MKLSTRDRYSARAMLDLAFHFDEAPILIKDIAIMALALGYCFSMM